MEIDNVFVQVIVAIITTAIASSGFWAFIQHKFDRNDNTKKLLIGIAHDRIMFIGMQYIQRGEITADEYENLRVYLYEPYKNAGGNGTATKVMNEVDKLPIVKELHGNVKF